MLAHEAPRRLVVNRPLVGMVDGQVRHMNPFDAGHGAAGPPASHPAVVPTCFAVPRFALCAELRRFSGTDGHHCGRRPSDERIHQRGNFGRRAAPEFALMFDDDISVVNPYHAQHGRQQERSVVAGLTDCVRKKPVGNGRAVIRPAARTGRKRKTVAHRGLPSEIRAYRRRLH